MKILEEEIICNRQKDLGELGIHYILSHLIHSFGFFVLLNSNKTRASFLRLFLFKLIKQRTEGGMNLNIIKAKRTECV